jgi:hypothetical protein
MIILLALFAFWFAELSTIPFRLNIALGHLVWLKYPLQLISCSKCLGFWICGLYYFNEYHNIGGAILLAGIGSLIAIVSSRTYYKLLS